LAQGEQVCSVCEHGPPPKRRPMLPLPLPIAGGDSIPGDQLKGCAKGAPA
jgi:hypothetical protein